MDYSIKDLPQSERPREKREKKDASSLTNIELLSLILRAGTTGKNVKELSAEILKSYPLESLADRSLEELKDFQGVSTVKAGQLKALGELSRRMQNENRKKIENLSDVEDEVQDMRFMESETVRTFFISSGNELLGVEEFEGEVSSAGISLQQVFKQALNSNASAIIMAHNHPSGESNPTNKDIKTTEELIEIGQKLGVSILDHIIVGDRIRSLRQDSNISF